MDVVIVNAGEIDVVNMSLGSQTGQPGTTPDPVCGNPNVSDFFVQIHNAFCRVVAAGVTVVVSAGNGYVDANTDMPARYDEVITVSALADSDGRRGGLGPATSYGADDAWYRNPAIPAGQEGAGSNWGADIDFAAPGVDILSTVPKTGLFSHRSGYRRISGTSMAAPHVAGAARSTSPSTGGSARRRSRPGCWRRPSSSKCDYARGGGGGGGGGRTVRVMGLAHVVDSGGGGRAALILEAYLIEEGRGGGGERRGGKVDIEY
jgi:subtilisin family serine protease